MGDTTVIKVDSSHSPKGPDGQVYLATGKNIAMRMWKEVAPGTEEAPVRREYRLRGLCNQRQGGAEHGGAGDPAQSRRFLDRAARCRA